MLVDRSQGAAVISPMQDRLSLFAAAVEIPLLAILPDGRGVPGAVERRFNAYYAEFLPVAADKRRPHDHGGAEFIYVLKGTLRLQIGTAEHTLGQGDAIYFDSSIPHSYARSGARPCGAIVVTAA
jgi:mannose-6-phosphate isomerase-like protein (cupin superfamily)